MENALVFLRWLAVLRLPVLGCHRLAYIERRTGALFAIILFSVVFFIFVPHPLAFCLSFSLRRGYDAEKSLFYYRSRNDKEVNFVTRQGAHVESLIQVCYDMTSECTLKREVDSLVECAGELKCSQLLIVTMSEERIIEKNGLEIKVVPIHKF